MNGFLLIMGFVFFAQGNIAGAIVFLGLWWLFKDC
jgi:hypothetical protein